MEEQQLNGMLDTYWNEPMETGARRDSLTVAEERLRDRVLGYLTSSLAALFMLVFLVPRWYRTWILLAEKLGHDPGLALTLGESFGSAGWFIYFHVGGFFVGGWAWNRSLRWGRSLVRYCLLVWGMNLLFELRYWGFVHPRHWDNWFWPLVFLLVPALVAAVAWQLRRPGLRTVRLLQFLGLTVSLANLFLIVRFFLQVSPESMPADRHLAYGIVALFAALIHQAATCGREMLPGAMMGRGQHSAD